MSLRSHFNQRVVATLIFLCVGSILFVLDGSFGVSINLADFHGKPLLDVHWNRLDTTHGNTSEYIHLSSALSERSDRKLGGDEQDHQVKRDEHEHHSSAFRPFIYFLLVYIGSVISQQSVAIIPQSVRPPHSVMLYIVGMLFAWIAKNSDGTEFGDSIAPFMEVDPHIIFWLFLPMLLYEDASSAPWHVVHRVLPSAILLAFPGVILNTVLTGGLVMLVSGMKFSSSLLLGSILSATDPVAVVGALSALQAPAKLSAIISGESLLNDGTAVVLFQIFLEVAAGRSTFEIIFATLKIIRLSLGGALLGLVVGVLADFWLKATRDFNIEMLLITICIYGTFFLAEHPKVHVSGVLAVVVFGFFMSGLGKHALARDKEHEHHAIVKFIALLSNEAIFIMAGVVGYGFSFQNDGITGRDWLNLFLLYLGVHVTRCLVVTACFPLLQRMGYHLSVKDAIICVYGGLRGAVGLAMGLLVFGDKDLDQSAKSKVAFYTNGIVIGTLFINGMTVTRLYKWLQIQSPFRKQHQFALQKVLMQQADEHTQQKIDSIRKHWFFHNTDVNVVNKLVPCLVESLFHAEEDYYGRRKHQFQKLDHIEAAMGELAKSMGSDPADHEAYFQAKIEKYRELGTFDVFRMTEHAAHPKEHSKAHESLPSKRENDSAPKRLNTARMLLEKHLINETADEEGVYNKKEVDDKGDEKGVLQQVLQVVVNANRARYTELFERHAINSAAYEVLSDAMDMQEEAINGDLRNYEFLQGDLSGLHNASHEEQMSKAVNVGCSYVLYMLNRSSNPLLRLMRKFVGSSSLTLEYWHVRRNISMLLVYNLTGGHLMEEAIHVSEQALQDHPRAQELVNQMLVLPLKDVMTKTIDCITQARQQDPQLFRLYECILFARLVVMQQSSILEELAEEGCVDDVELSNIIKNVIGPARFALKKFCPSIQMMKDAGAAADKYTPRFDSLARLVAAVALRPVN